jgi:hypothetical protein
MPGIVDFFRNADIFQSLRRCGKGFCHRRQQFQHLDLRFAVALGKMGPNVIFL